MESEDRKILRLQAAFGHGKRDTGIIRGGFISCFAVALDFCGRGEGRPNAAKLFCIEHIEHGTLI